MSKLTKNGGSVRHRPDRRWEARAIVGGKRRSFYDVTQGETLKSMRAAMKADDDGMYFDAADDARRLARHVARGVRRDYRYEAYRLDLSEQGRGQTAHRGGGRDIPRRVRKGGLPRETIADSSRYVHGRAIRGELCGLSWDSMNRKTSTITVKQQLQKEKTKGGAHYIEPSPKGNRNRVITLAPFVMELLKRIRSEQGEAMFLVGTAWANEWNLVFTNPLGRVVRRSDVPTHTFTTHGIYTRSQPCRRATT